MRILMLYPLCALIALFIGAACSSAEQSTPEQTVTADTLAGRTWTAAVINTKQTDPEVKSFIIFEPDGKVNGSGGCNNFFGTWLLEPESFNIGPLGATKMFCRGPKGEQEILFFQALEQTDGAKIIEDTLVLYSGKDKEVMRLEPN